MARIRTIKPEFWTDAKVLRVSPLARLLLLGMWNFADDRGVLEADPLQLKARIFPNDQVDVEKLLQELQSVNLIKVFEVKGKQYLWISDFLTRWQRIGRPRPSELPAPPEWGRGRERGRERGEGDYRGRGVGEGEREREREGEQEREQERERILRELFDHWNSLGIIRHRNFEEFRPYLHAALERYSPEEVKAAMDNYARVLQDPRFFWTHRWGLNQFLTRKNALDRFLPENFDPVDYLRKEDREALEHTRYLMAWAPSRTQQDDSTGEKEAGILEEVMAGQE